jgi:hypothetical protein
MEGGGELTSLGALLGIGGVAAAVAVAADDDDKQPSELVTVTAIASPFSPD